MGIERTRTRTANECRYSDHAEVREAAEVIKGVLMTTLKEILRVFINQLQ